MTYKMAQTKLEGFPYQYGPRVVQPFNQVVSRVKFDNTTLQMIAKTISPNVVHTMGAETEDKYYWYSKLEYVIDDAKVAILLPWAQDFKHPKTNMDRSANVYSNKPVDEQKVSKLLETLAIRLEFDNPYPQISVM
jgi:hypothetical protein